ncbi:hypothetical protein M758_9G092900 [Ceratodon purpureus]|nr:hypothetical protein M758_9G092900 [Ceratodon purpureus]
MVKMVAFEVGVLMIFLITGNFVDEVGAQTVMDFSLNELDALQSLWGAWNESTSNTNLNLAGWSSSGGKIFYPCNNNIERKWRGVSCLEHQVNESSVINWIIGLTLDDASIGGILPPEIGKLNNLVTLTLTGNPNLTGPLPTQIGDLPLNILDLHDNGFDGVIPTELAQLRNLLQLDLSGNRFVGQFPAQFIVKTKTAMQVFRISRNLLEGDIPPLAFQNMTQLLTIDLSDNGFTGLPPNLTSIPNLSYLNLSSNLFTGLAPLPAFFSRTLPQRIAILDLSGLNIGGGVPDWNAMGLSTLDHLYLDGNNFTGELNVSAVFGSSIGRSLKVLSLKDNKITKVVYTDAIIGAQSTILLQGNPYCQVPTSDDDGRRCYCEQICFVSPKTSGSSNEIWKIIVIAISFSAGVLGLVILIFSLILHRNRKRMRSLYKALEGSEVKTKRFEYRELRAATRNFSPAMKLGAGAFGAVYKGILSNKTEIAVKQLFLKTKEGRDDFINEVLLIGNLQHRNLVTLKGYSLHGKEMLLVYEYLENRDLDKLLVCPQCTPNPHSPLDWQARKNICLGVAQGLYYLHASSQSRILHRDVKASNVLLDKNHNPKIADFGLARPIQDGRSKIVTERRAGTLGYLAPEYLFFGQVSEKADVFSFGVLILEILSGRRNRHYHVSEDEEYLPVYAWKLQSEGKLMDLLDRRLQLDPNNISEKMEVQRVLNTGILCVEMSPEKRPTMFRVLAMLGGDTETIVPKTVDPNTWLEFQSLSFADNSPGTGTASKSIGITNGNATVELTEVQCR